MIKFLMLGNHITLQLVLSLLVLRISKYNEENNVIAETLPLVALVFREEARKTPGTFQ